MNIDLAHLLKLRLVVARYGEMDRARWWNTQGVLGRRGSVVYQRGFPRTHWFAQARVVFAVAQTRCAEIFSAPGSITLWSLPAALEDQFSDGWQNWLDEIDKWEPFFLKLEEAQGADLLQELQDLGLIGEQDKAAVKKLQRTANNRAVELPAVSEPTDHTFGLLAAASSRGEPGAPAVPFARVAG